MNDKEAAIKQFREALTQEYRLAIRVKTARELLEEERKKFFSQGKITEALKYVLLNEHGLEWNDVEQIDNEALVSSV